MRSRPTLEEDYGDFPLIEEEFQEFLDESLSPRGLDFLYEVVRQLGLSAGANVLDLGCGEGAHSMRLAKESGFEVVGIDPVARNIEVGSEALSNDPALAGRVRFEAGSAEAIPLADAAVDLIWCKEVLMFAVPDRAFAECRRVLRDGGRMVIYQVFRTERLEPKEAALLDGGVARMARESVEEAFTAAGFVVEEHIELGGEGGEYGQERTGEPGRRLVHAARLLRDPERYVTRFGKTNYDIMLGDCLWHIYRMIGKLSAHVYVLRAPGAKAGRS